MSTEKYASAAKHAVDAVVSFVRGNHADGVRSLIEGALDVYPAEAVKHVVDDAAVRRANAVADAIENARFGKGP